MFEFDFNLKIGKNSHLKKSNNDTNTENKISESSQYKEEKSIYDEMEENIRLEDEIKNKIEDEKWYDARQKIRNAVGWKDFEEIQNPVWQTIRIVLNRISCLLHFPLVKSKDIIGHRMSLIFFAMITAMPFEFVSAISLIIILFSVLSLSTFLLSFVFPFQLEWNVMYVVICIAAVVCFWLLFGVTRIISIELNKTRDYGFVLAMFGGECTFVFGLISCWPTIIGWLSKI